LAIAARANDNVTFRGALGTGYRAPDFKELYISFANAAAGYAVEGNPDLRPERSVSASLGIHANLNKWSARATVFANRFRDFITTGQQDAAGVFRYENIESGSTRGVETEVTFALGTYHMEVGYDYTATREHESDAPFPGISPHHARLAFTPPEIGSVSVTLATHYSAATPLTRGESGTLQRQREAFARTDLRFSRPISAQLRARGGVTNLFNRSLGDDWPGFTGRQIFAGLDWNPR
jgi:outer membrane receptor for ferrienterochelin and colicins